MRPFAAPPPYEMPAWGSLTDDVLAQVDVRPDAVGFSRTDPGAPGVWEDVTYMSLRW